MSEAGLELFGLLIAQRTIGRQNDLDGLRENIKDAAFYFDETKAERDPSLNRFVLLAVAARGAPLLWHDGCLTERERMTLISLGDKLVAYVSGVMNQPKPFFKLATEMAKRGLM